MKNTFLQLLSKKEEEEFRVVELGCGPGWLSKSILETFPKAEVVALDGSKQMLEHAREKMEHFKSRVTFDLFRLEELDWIDPLDQQVDCFVSSLVIHHLDDEEKKEFFQRLYDALLPGGALIIADVMKANSKSLANYWADEWEKIVQEQSMELFGDLRGLDVFIKEKWNMYHFPDDPADKPSLLSDQLRWLEQAGFKGVDVSWLKAGHAIFGGYKE
ncbi:class I SAM-dependent methyltransferase [Marininema mesophilum]|nr:class I SAM-dependent methyltransferase [Marininema mesophilum]